MLLVDVQGRQRLDRLWRRLLIVTRRQECSRDQEQTHDTAQLGHGETPFCFAPRDNSHNPKFALDGMTYDDRNLRFVTREVGNICEGHDCVLRCFG